MSMPKITELPAMPLERIGEWKFFQSLNLAVKWIDSNSLLKQFVPVPLSSLADGEIGDYSYDDDYFYFYVAAKKWRRITFGTW